MKMQKILSLFLVCAFACFSFMLCGFTFFKKKETKQDKKVEQTVQNFSDMQSDLWCVTFQLVWNEFMQKITNGQPVQFVGGNPPIADELNKQNYTKDILSNNSYYIADGKISKSLKRKIERAIKKKFKETSDILDFVDWNAKDSYLFYSMLKKEFNYQNPFDELASLKFNNSVEKVKYFGIHPASSSNVRENVQILFYNSPDEYAVRILTKENEDVILFRTDKDDNFENYYSYVVENSSVEPFTKYDNLRVPEINVDKMVSYNDLIGKQISGTKYVISQALQTIKFKLDRKGGSLKSEAVIGVMKMSLINPDKERDFFFDKPFVIFLKEQCKDKPYYAMKVDTTEYLVKE
ncbi:MAG: hypothetical protein IJY61_07485 [Candidatus Gastranaerophilales bacterium]|nr:hypothetical protein [Candidatus Gastranaerophilales bacterium]